MSSGLRIGVCDIENSPMIAYAWDTFNTNISIDAIIEPKRILCFAWKWLGESRVQFYSEFHDGREEMIQAARDLLDECDAVISYNGIRHDTPHLQTAIELAQLDIPSPFRDIDLYQTVKKQFKFDSNKLDWAAQQLGVGNKLQNRGMALWKDVLAGNEQAWREMRAYNKQDVVLTEAVHDRIKPWIKNYPSYAAATGEDVCPTCGSENLQQRGFSMTATGRFQRLQCQDCGKWSKNSKRLSGTSIVGIS